MKAVDVVNNTHKPENRFHEKKWGAMTNVTVMPWNC
jgi:hypothetical protein